MKLTRWERLQAEKRRSGFTKGPPPDYWRDALGARCLCGAPGAFPCQRCHERFAAYVASVQRRLYAEAAREEGRWADDGGRWI